MIRISYWRKQPKKGCVIVVLKALMSNDSGLLIIEEVDEIITKTEQDRNLKDHDIIRELSIHHQSSK